MKESDLIKTLVEGLNHSRENHQLNYRSATLSISKDATHINDGDFIYQFYGRTDFEKITPGNYSELKTIFVDRIKKMTELSRPRAIITSNGKIFVEQNNLLSKEYLGLLEKRISEAEKIFNAQNYKD